MIQQQQRSNASAGAQEIILPMAQQPEADAVLSTSRNMSRDDQYFALAFLRGMRFQQMLSQQSAAQQQSAPRGA